LARMYRVGGAWVCIRGSIFRDVGVVLAGVFESQSWAKGIQKPRGVFTLVRYGRGSGRVV
jgi:hypothetical protein